MMRGRQSVTALLLAAVTVAAYGQGQPPTTEPEIITDRPDITESSIVIPKGSLQLENGLTWTNDHGQQTLDLSETLLRFGVFDRTELRIVVPNYVAGLTGPTSASSFGDVAVGVKQQLGPLRGGFDLSVIVALSMPTGGIEFRATASILSLSFRGPRISRRAGRLVVCNRYSGTQRMAGGT